MKYLSHLALSLASLTLVPAPAQGATGCSQDEMLRQVAALAPAHFYEGPTLEAANIRADFDGWLTQMRILHPDMALRTDLPAFEQMATELRQAIAQRMTQRQAWLLFAQLNPTLRDGHNGIVMPNVAGLMQTHIEAGGRVFPLRIRIDSSGAMRVGETSGAARTGATILTINGEPASRIVATLLGRAPGDTLAFRRAWLSRRFTGQYWLTYGDTKDYVLTLQSERGCPTTMVIPGAPRLAESDLAEPPASHQFASRILDGGIGYIKAGSFGGEYGAQFAQFARSAFTQFNQAGVRALIIDVRENSGGDDPLWQQNIMEYITSKPYAHVGRFAVRVNPDNADPGDIIGEVQHRDYRRRFTPSAANPLRLDVPVYILAGRFTYSSAVQFLVAAQDFQIGRIAGPETGALSCQTGQVRFMSMPSTGLRAFTPVIAFTRPSGQGCDRGVIPDVPIDDEGIDPERAINILAQHIRSQRN